MFSAKMRLDRSDPAVTKSSILKFVNKTIKLLELNSIQDFVVGSGVGGGLSFEQKKRLCRSGGRGKSKHFVSGMLRFSEQSYQIGVSFQRHLINLLFLFLLFLQLG